MDKTILFFEEYTTLANILLTIGIVVVGYLTRIITYHQIRKNKSIPIDIKRRWSLNINTTLSVTILIFIAVIWGSQVKAAAFSILAIAVPVVLATKELILCVAGAFYKISSGDFSVGDRIEFDGVRGDVIDRGLLAVRLLEIGPQNKTHQYTGRSVTIPNSMFLSKPIINESFLHDFVLHTFSIPLAIHKNWEEAEKIILKAAIEECNQYLEPAQRYMDRIQSRRNLVTPGIEPRVHVNVVSTSEIQLIIRVTVPASEKGKIEQRIVRKFLSQFQMGA